jgi:hypothetical protein
MSSWTNDILDKCQVAAMSGWTNDILDKRRLQFAHTSRFFSDFLPTCKFKNHVIQNILYSGFDYFFTELTLPALTK